MERKTYIKFRVTRIERKIIQKKAQAAGMTTSEFLRRLAFKKELKARLNEEEVKCYKLLLKYKDNFRRISNLFRLGDTTRVKEESLRTAKMIGNHLEKFKN